MKEHFISARNKLFFFFLKMQNAELMHYRNQYAEKLCRKILYAKTAEKPECRMHVVQNCRNAEK